VAAKKPLPALMKLGCQSAPSNEVHFGFLARYGVRNVCGYPEIAGGRLYATVDELKQLRDLGDRMASVSIAWHRRSFPRATSTWRSTAPFCWRRAGAGSRHRGHADADQELRGRRDCFDQIQHEPPGRIAHRRTKAVAIRCTAPGN